VNVGTGSDRGSAGVQTPVADLRAGRLRTRLGAADVALHLWRSKLLMFLVFLPIALLGVAASLMAPTTYSASTQLLVRQGPDNVFDPTANGPGRGAFARQDERLQAERELALSPIVAERVIKQIGLRRLYPDLAAAAQRAQPGRRSAIEQAALETFARNAGASAPPQSSILRMTFAHPNPALAVETLDAFVTNYMAYRLEVLAGRGAAGFSEQRSVIESRLEAADRSIRSYLERTGLSDFEAEREAVTRLYGELSDQQAQVSASLRETEAKVQGLRRQLAATPREIDLYTETSTEKELFDLRLERDKLLVRYKPDSIAVQDIDKRIAQMEAFVRSGAAGGVKRRGANPTFQSIEASLAAAQAGIDALAGRQAALAGQKAETEDRRQRLAVIEPEYRRLARERDALEASAGAFAAREQTELSRTEMAARSADTISIYEKARTPAKGASPRRLIIAAAAGLGLFAALAVGLLRVLTVGVFATAGSLERTLGVRVLATTRERG